MCLYSVRGSWSVVPCPCPNDPRTSAELGVSATGNRSFAVFHRRFIFSPPLFSLFPVSFSFPVVLGIRRLFQILSPPTRIYILFLSDTKQEKQPPRAHSFRVQLFLDNSPLAGIGRTRYFGYSNAVSTLEKPRTSTYDAPLPSAIRGRSERVTGGPRGPLRWRAPVLRVCDSRAYYLLTPGLLYYEVLRIKSRISGLYVEKIGSRSSNGGARGVLRRRKEGAGGDERLSVCLVNV